MKRIWHFVFYKNNDLTVLNKMVNKMTYEFGAVLEKNKETSHANLTLTGKFYNQDLSLIFKYEKFLMKCYRFFIGTAEYKLVSVVFSESKRFFKKFDSNIISPFLFLFSI